MKRYSFKKNIFLTLLFLSTLSVAQVFVPFSFWSYLKTNLSWPFTVSAQYILNNANDTEVAFGYGRLRGQLNARDADNSASGFGGGSHNNTFYNITTSAVELNPVEQNSAWTPAWANVVGYWKFDEKTGATLNPTVGTNGTVVSGTSFSSGKVNGALSINSATDYISIANSAYSSPAMTIGFWINISSYGNTAVWRSIISKCCNGGVREFGLWFASGTNAQIHFSGTNGSNFNSASQLNLNQWYYVTAVLNGAASKIYFNGVENATGSLTVGTPANSLPIYIGRNPGSEPYDTANFMMDELVIWNTALTQAQVQTIFNRQASKFGTIPLNGLVRWYDFDESVYNGTAGEVKDTSGNNNHAAAVNGNLINNSIFKIGNSSSYNGTNQYINLGSDSTNYDNGLTISIWAYPTANNNWARFFDCGNGASSNNFVLARSGTSDVIHAEVYNGATGGGVVSAAGAIVNNTWQHFVATYSKAGTFNIYKNGALIKTGAAQPIPANLTRTNCWIGRSNWAGDAYYVGYLDQFLMYNRVLSADEVQQIYSSQQGNVGRFQSRVMNAGSNQSWNYLSWLSQLPYGKELPTSNESSSDYTSVQGTLVNGLVGLWHLNETATGQGVGGTAASDSSAQANHLTLVNAGLTYGSSGKIKTAFTFNSSAYLQKSGPSAGALPTGNTYSVAAWVKRATTSATGSIFQCGPSGGFHIGIGVTPYSGNQIKLTKYTVVDITAGSFPTDTNWNHLAVVYSATGVSVYINAVLVGSSSNTSNFAACTGGFRIGGSEVPFNGLIDEVAAWNRAVTTAEIKELYLRGASRLKFQIRSCADATCSANPSFKGPDNTEATYFTEINNNTNQNSPVYNGVLATSPKMTFASFASFSAGATQYVQYRAVLETDSLVATDTPKLTQTTVGPYGFATGTPWIYTDVTGGVSIRRLHSMSVVYGPNGCTIDRYVLSADKINWYYFNGVSWQNSLFTSGTASTVAQINAGIYNFTSTLSLANLGPLYVGVLMNSNGTTPCEIDQINMSADRF
jgi:Concanavalin A-like lectin/glucanases superfamily